MRIDSGKDIDKLMKELRAIAAKLDDSEEYVMVHHPAFRVGKKPFAIAGMDHETKGATVSINWGPDAQRQFLDDARFARTPYIGQHGWVTVAHAKLKRGELAALVTESWKRVAKKKKKR
jgi:predicted DNA-binding protein (MmcQ/YjbR family)